MPERQHTRVHLTCLLACAAFALGSGGSGAAQVAPEALDSRVRAIRQGWGQAEQAATTDAERTAAAKTALNQILRAIEARPDAAALALDAGALATLTEEIIEMIPASATVPERLYDAHFVAQRFRARERHGEHARVYAALLPHFPALSSARAFTITSLANARRDEGKLIAARALLEDDRRMNMLALVSVSARKRAPAPFSWIADRVLRGLGYDVDDPAKSELEGVRARAFNLIVEAWIHLALRLPDRAAAMSAQAFDWVESADGTLTNVRESALELMQEIELQSARYERAAELARQTLDDPMHATEGDFLAACALRLGIALRWNDDAAGAVDALRSVSQFEGATLRARWEALLWLAEVALDHPDLVDANRAIADVRAFQATGGSLTNSPVQAARWRALESAWMSVDAAEATDQDRADGLEQLQVAFDRLTAHWRDLSMQSDSAAHIRTNNVLYVLGQLVESNRQVHGDAAAARVLVETLAEVQSIGALGRALHDDSYSHERLVQRLAGAGGGLLAYLPGPRHGFVAAIDEDQAVLHQLPSREPLIRRLSLIGTRLRADAAARKGEPSVTDPSELRWASEALLPPSIVQRMETWSIVGVVGGEMLSAFPLESLPMASWHSNRAGEEPVRFGEALAVGYLPSLPIALLLADRADAAATSRHERCTVVSGVRHSDWAHGFAPFLPELGLTEDSFSRMLQPLESDSVDLRLAERAQRGALAAEPIGTDGQLLLLSHGLRLDTADCPAAILLDENVDDTVKGTAPLLTADFVTGLKSPPLVVMAACGAGYEPRRDGDAGSASLAGAWFSAGAAAVIEPRGEITLGRTLAQITFYLEALTEGDSPAEALRRSRIKLRVQFALRDSGAFLHAVGWPFSRGAVAPSVRRRRTRSNVLRCAMLGALLLCGVGLTKRMRALREDARGAQRS